ncbi:DNA polymerase III subunit delta [Candidatus Desantisbacteria bacterium]|nr:DNA polymerase III subunit delta [Candidatus Desantisbacteria bacterium]
MITYKQLLPELKKSNPLSVYLFAGPEEYLKEECIEIIKRRLFSPDDSIELNLQIIYGDNAGASTIINACKTMLFGAKKRLVIVKNFSKLSQEDKKQLTPYLKSPAAHTCLILITDKTEKGAGHGGCEVVNFYSLYESEVSDWIQRQVQGYKKKITPDATLTLISRAGTGLLELKSEIEKLCFYAGEKEYIKAIDVLEVTSENREATIFELMDAIGLKRAQQAIKALDKLLSQKEEPVKILFMITKHLRTIFKLKLLQEQKMSLPEIWPMIDVKFTKQQASFLAQSKFYHEQSLKKAFELLLETDISLKSQDIRLNSVVMEVLVCRLCLSSERICSSE